METGKKTGSQVKTAISQTGQDLRGEPVKAINKAMQQAGLKPSVDPQEEAERIQKLKQEEQQKKSKGLSFWRSRVAEYQQVSQQTVSAKSGSKHEPPASSLDIPEKKKLPAPVTAAKLKGPERKELKSAS